MRGFAGAVLAILPGLLPAAPSGCGALCVVVADKAAGQVHLIDADAGELRGTVAVGLGPHEVACGAAGCVVSNYGDASERGHSLSLIDPLSMEEIARIDTGLLARPHGLAVRDGKAWFSAEGARAVARVDLATAAVDWQSGTGWNGSHMIALDSQRRRLFVTSIPDHRLTAIDLEAEQGFPRIRHAETRAVPEGVAVRPRHGEVWVGHNQAGEVMVFDADSLEPLAVIEGQARVPFRIAFSGDGDLAVVTDPLEQRVLVLDAGTRKLLHAVPAAGQPVGVATRNREAWVTDERGGRLYRIDLDRGRVVASLTVGPGIDGIDLWTSPTAP